MNKLEQINKLFSYYRSILIQNPNIDLAHNSLCDLVYHDLIHLGVKPEEENVDLENDGCFNYWVDSFKDKENSNVFIDPNWSYFCQFQTGYPTKFDNYMKLYVPLDQAHIKKGVDEIFNFLDEFNIHHVSKVSKQIRFDDVVIRLSTEFDLIKLTNFIKNNDYINEGLLSPNPFAFSKDNLTLVVDNNFSYNEILSTYISIYLISRKNHNNIDKISSNDFLKYLNGYYKYTFVDKKGIPSLISDFNIKGNLSKGIVSVMQITELIISSNTQGFTYDNFITHFINCDNNDLCQDKIREFSNHLDKIHYVTVEDTEKLNELTYNAVEIMANKYGEGKAINNLEEYIHTGNNKFVTRDTHLREILDNYNYSEKIKRLLAMKHETFRKHLYKSNSLYFIMEKTLVDYISAMDEKFGEGFALMSIKTYLVGNNKGHITRDKNLRTRISDKYFTNELKNFLKVNDMTIEEYFSYLEEKYQIKKAALK